MEKGTENSSDVDPAIWGPQPTPEQIEATHFWIKEQDKKWLMAVIDTSLRGSIAAQEFGVDFKTVGESIQKGEVLAFSVGSTDYVPLWSVEKAEDRIKTKATVLDLWEAWKENNMTARGVSFYDFSRLLLQISEDSELSPEQLLEDEELVSLLTEQFSQPGARS